ncbi:hypothetical protein ACQVP2_31820 [Methylobacterium aquaticum]|uniref:hypothetical protein n=1 Tax=Methylobacterium aquaticum TaxID=270351 RepID=UPI003D1858C8
MHAVADTEMAGLIRDIEAVQASLGSLLQRMRQTFAEAPETNLAANAFKRSSGRLTDAAIAMMEAAFAAGETVKTISERFQVQTSGVSRRKAAWERTRAQATAVHQAPHGEDPPEIIRDLASAPRPVQSHEVRQEPTGRDAVDALPDEVEVEVEVAEAGADQRIVDAEAAVAARGGADAVEIARDGAEVEVAPEARPVEVAPEVDQDSIIDDESLAEVREAKRVVKRSKILAKMQGDDFALEEDDLTEYRQALVTLEVHRRLKRKAARKAASTARQARGRTT